MPGAPRTVVPMERANHPHPVWAVCGYSDAAVCAVILEEDGQSEYSDAPVRVGCGLFHGAVHTHRFPEGESNWYLPLALGLNCVALFLNAAQRRKQQKKEKAKE